MSILYESHTCSSIYDVSLDHFWFSVNRYYAITYPYREMEELHAHTETEIMYVTSGKCIINLEKSQVPLREGDYIFIDSLVPHSLTVTADNPCHMLNFEAALSNPSSAIRLETLLQDNDFRSFRAAGLPVLLCRDDGGTVKNGILNLHRLLLNKTSSMGVDFQLSNIFLEMGYQFFHKRKTNPQRTFVYIKRALDFIAQNFDHELTIDDVAEAAGISKAHLQRTFRSSQGCTLVEMINRLRLDKAKLLLETTNIPIVEIVFEVGFSSRQYFHDLFLRTVGVSPALYRKHQRGNMAAGFNNADMGVELSYNG